MRFLALITLCPCLALSACISSPAGSEPIARNRPEQGRYQYPENQRPIPTRAIPAVDDCNARLYQGLVRSHIGAVHIAAIASDKRIISPGVSEIDQDDFFQDMRAAPPLLEVREMLVGQPLYLATVRTGVYPGQLGPTRPDRLTLELDAEGFIDVVECG